MAIELTAYKCEFCKKLFVSKKRIETHQESICFYSPRSKGCVTCKHIHAAGPSDYKCELGHIGSTEEEYDEGVKEYTPAKLIKQCDQWEIVDLSAPRLDIFNYTKRIGLIVVDEGNVWSHLDDWRMPAAIKKYGDLVLAEYRKMQQEKAETDSDDIDDYTLGSILDTCGMD